MDAQLTGKIISAKRKEMGLTQIQLAELLNVSNRTISKWENGDGFPDITLLPEISEILGITIDELLTGKAPVAVQKEENGKLLNNYRILLAISVFLALFSALLGGITELYNMSVFPCTLFYNHWEIMFAAVSLGSLVASAAVLIIGAIRLHLSYTKREIIEMSKKHFALISVLVCIFPLTFIARILTYIIGLPIGRPNIALIITALIGIGALALIYIIYKRIGGDKNEKNK